MGPLYNLGISLYGLGIRIASVRNVKARKLVDGHRGVEAYLRSHVAGKEGPWVWIHVASLGEFEQARPLIERLRAERPGLKLLLTFFSPSGYEVRRHYDKVDAVCYLPLDRRHAVRRFLDLVRPSMAIFVKYEFWGNYLSELRRRSIPTYIISAIFRKGQIFFRPYGGEFRKILRSFKHLYVQDEPSRKRLASIGIHNVTVAGDTRFDRVTAIMRSAIDLKSVDRFTAGVDNIIVAGSSWPPDEELLIPWLGRHPGVKAIFAPHEFDKKRLHAMTAQLSVFGPTALMSQIRPSTDMERLRFIVVDSFGLLAGLYRKATIAYVGGGFGTGIHNINEAAAYGIPVVFGPRHGKFKEAADLIACGGAFDVHDADSLDDVLGRLTAADTTARTKAGRAAGDYIAASVGATDKIFDDIFNNSPHD